MVDRQGRIVIGKELISRQNLLSSGQTVDICFDPEKKVLLIKPENAEKEEGEYFIQKVKLDEKNRIVVPVAIRDVFPEARFIPAENNGNIYILIIENKKSEY